METSKQNKAWGNAIVWSKEAEGKQPAVTYRQGGNDHLIVEFGHESFDLNHRCRVTALEKQLWSADSPQWLKHGLVNSVGCSLPVDPRQRMSAPKLNPSRVFTPAGTVGWGGRCMSIYPVDSPGGYQITGRTVPCFDRYGYRKEFSLKRPWLFSDFDLITYYRVSEKELDDILTKFNTRTYQFEIKDVEFDMTEHSSMLKETDAEVRGIRQKERKVQKEMARAEDESLAKWREEMSKNQVDQSTVDALLGDPAISPIEALVDANVWKVEVEEGKTVKAGQTVAILEAMKLEIAVKAPEHMKGEAKIEKLLVRPGETIKAGGKIALLRKD